MSVAFAESVRVMLLDNATVASAIPGGISPDQISQSNASWPAADYSNVTGEPFSSIAGLNYGAKECSLELRVICETMAQVKTAQNAIEAVIEANRTRKVVGSNVLYNLRSSSATTSTDDITDGNDEPYRVLTMTITGWVT